MSGEIDEKLKRRLVGRSSVVLLFVAALSLPSGCNVIDAIRGKHANVIKMVPGGNVANGGLDCWLTFELTGYPNGVDPLDLEVRFESPALAAPARFDWAYIAARDVMDKGGKFGSGYRDAANTRPDEAPPLGEPVKVRFGLQALPEVEHASTLWLEAQVYWGGELMDSERRTIEHVYSRTGGGFF